MSSCNRILPVYICVFIKFFTGIGSVFLKIFYRAHVQKVFVYKESRLSRTFCPF